ncbi:hemolysin III family protein [Mycoplasmatota bacterium]|nr:hemolysin III family protein [Mycoplasmatota bacterium]
MKAKFREPINALTHLIGAFLAVIGLIVLLIETIVVKNTSTSIISVIIFGISMILLYTASGIYHMVRGSDSLIYHLKKVDHSMIYVLIAGTYTPFCLLGLEGAWKWTFILLIWSFAIVGVMLSIFYIDMPRFIKTTLYIIMGWLAIFAIYPLYLSISLYGIIWLVLGGIVYTIGGVIYGLKKPNLSIRFGSHELFHICVMLGSCFHYWAILKYIILK